MDIRIFDVEHGDCILVLSSRNEAVLVDCGYNATTGWRPSKGLADQGFGSRRKLHHLILTHPDQDHLADLPGVSEKLKPLNVWQHPQLSLVIIVRTLNQFVQFPDSDRAFLVPCATGDGQAVGDGARIKRHGVASAIPLPMLNPVLLNTCH